MSKEVHYSYTQRIGSFTSQQLTAAQEFLSYTDRRRLERKARRRWNKMMGDCDTKFRRKRVKQALKRKQGGKVIVVKHA